MSKFKAFLWDSLVWLIRIPGVVILLVYMALEWITGVFDFLVHVVIIYTDYCWERAYFHKYGKEYTLTDSIRKDQL